MVTTNDVKGKKPEIPGIIMGNTTVRSRHIGKIMMQLSKSLLEKNIKDFNHAFTGKARNP